MQLLQCPSKHQVRPPGRGTNSSASPVLRASMFLKGEAGAEGRQSLRVERQAEAKKPHNHRQISTSVSLSLPACPVWVTTCTSHLLCWAARSLCRNEVLGLLQEDSPRCQPVGGLAPLKETASSNTTAPSRDSLHPGLITSGEARPAPHPRWQQFWGSSQFQSSPRAQLRLA